MDSRLVVSHSQELSVSFRYSQQFLEASKLAPITSPSSLTTEDETPASRKKVTMTKKQSQEVFIRRETKILDLSMDDSLWSTPSRKDAQNSAKGTAKTIKKGQSMQEMTFLPMTVNRNKHAAKAFTSSPYVPGTGSQKLRKSPVFGKRKFEEYEEDEYDVAYKQKTKNLMTPEFKEDTLKPLVNLDAKRVKITEVEKPAPAQPVIDQIYLYNHTTEKMDCYPLYLDKDLGFNGFIQTTLREAEVDNDCATDTEVLDKVFQWTLDDLYDGIKKHYEENEVEDGKTENEKEEAYEKAKEKWKRYLFGCGELSSGAPNDESRDHDRSHDESRDESHSGSHDESRDGSCDGTRDESEVDRSTSEEYSSNYQEIKIAKSGNRTK